MEKNQTADHIFTLKSIIDSYKSKKKKVFACFIDLKKAFATVWRKGLFYILLEKKIPPNFVHVINSLYEETKIRVIFVDGCYCMEKGTILYTSRKEDSPKFCSCY